MQRIWYTRSISDTSDGQAAEDRGVELMVNKIVDCICEALFEEFGDTYEIYAEPVEQGLQEPCFSVSVQQSTILPQPGNITQVTADCLVQYYPSKEEVCLDCQEVLVRLYDCLGLMQMGTGFARAIHFQGEISDDGVLEVHFSVSKRYRLEAETTLMQQAQSEIVTDGGVTQANYSSDPQNQNTQVQTNEPEKEDI